jgi:DNA-binding PadR family transcriptional regulator
MPNAQFGSASPVPLTDRDTSKHSLARHSSWGGESQSMTMEQLRPFAYVVLALVEERGAGAHDIASMMTRSPVYWDAAQGQWYAEPKRLAELGYLRAEEHPGRTAARTHHTITAKGRRVLRTWPSSRPVHADAERGGDPPARR